jgi:hypothetical protein
MSTPLFATPARQGDHGTHGAAPVNGVLIMGETLVSGTKTDILPMISDGKAPRPGRCPLQGHGMANVWRS